MKGPILFSGMAAGLVVLTALVMAPGHESATVPGPLADTAVTSRSIAFFEGRLAREPDNLLVIRQLVARLMTRFAVGAELSDVERADSLSRILVARDRSRVAALSRLVGVSLAQHRFVEARAAAHQAVALDSTDAAALGAMFDASLAGGDYAAARWALSRLPAGDMASEVRQAQWADTRGDAVTAVSKMSRVCRRLDDSHRPAATVAWCLVELARMELNAVDTTEARVLFDRAFRQLPGYRGGAEGLADLAFAEGRFRQAVKLYRSIAAPAHPDLYLRLSESHAALGDSMAANYYRSRFLAIAGDPDQRQLFGLMLAKSLAQSADPTDKETALEILLVEAERRPALAVLRPLMLLVADVGEQQHLAEVTRRLANARAVLNTPF